MTASVLNRILLVLGYGGVFVAGVLSLAEILHKDVPCGVSRGCEMVARDASSHLLGIPNAYIGFLAYLVLAGLATYRELAGIGGRSGRITINIGYGFAAFGTVASIGLTFIAVTEIHATCKWCLASAAIMTVTLFAYMLLTLRADEAPKIPGRGVTGLILVPLCAVASIAGIGVAAASFSTPSVISGPLEPDDLSLLIGKDAHVKNPDGVVTVVEFADLDCPTCKKVFPQLEQMVANSNGKLRLVFHHFPLYQLPDHRGALPGAVVAEIAGEQGKFWDYVEAIYGNGVSNPSVAPPVAADMFNMATKIGIKGDFEKRVPDLDDPAFKRVQNDLFLAAHYGIMSTPSFIIIAKGMDKKTVSGSGVFDVLDEPEYKKLLAGK